MLFEPINRDSQLSGGPRGKESPLANCRLARAEYDALDEIGAAAILARHYPDVTPVAYETVRDRLIPIERGVLGQAAGEQFFAVGLDVVWRALGTLPNGELVGVLAVEDDTKRFWLPPEHGTGSEIIEHAVIKSSPHFVGFLAHQSVNPADYVLDTIASPSVIEAEIQRARSGALDGIVGETFFSLVRSKRAEDPSNTDREATIITNCAPEIDLVMNVTTDSETIAFLAPCSDGSLISFEWKGRGMHDVPAGYFFRYDQDPSAKLTHFFRSREEDLTVLDGLSLKFSTSHVSSGGGRGPQQFHYSEDDLRGSLERIFPVIGDLSYSIQVHGVWEPSPDSGRDRYLAVTIHNVVSGQKLLPPDRGGRGDDSENSLVVLKSAVPSEELTGSDQELEFVGYSFPPTFWDSEFKKLVSDAPQVSFFFLVLRSAIDKFCLHSGALPPREIRSVRLAGDSDDDLIDAALLVESEQGSYLVGMCIEREGWFIRADGGVVVRSFFPVTDPVPITARPFLPEVDDSDDDHEFGDEEEA